MNLNRLALRRCESMIESARNIAVLRDESGSRLIDCGVHVRGGLDVGRQLAEVCLAGLGQVDIIAGDSQIWSGPAVSIRTDSPVESCMASQYAGWQIAGEKYFAMGSGPMRCVRGKEKLLADIGHHETAQSVIGVLESGKLPTRDVCHHISSECRVDPEQLTLLIAPTSSLAGTVQVVARTVETTLHKLHELGFDLKAVVSGFGVAPLPPVAKDDLTGIGVTNDAILYGGEVTLWVEAEDDRLAELISRIPSSASADYGQPFGEIFKRYNHDFYKIDPLLFSPAVVNVVNLNSGRTFRAGKLSPQVLKRSFAAT
jgi:methenyltetrahydromethanopterin cyclohydrolase